MIGISTARSVRGTATQAWLALVAVYLFWGSTYLAIRVGVRDLPPAMMSGIRYS